jgi:hypothetical protein
MYKLICYWAQYLAAEYPELLWPLWEAASSPAIERQARQQYLAKALVQIAELRPQRQNQGQVQHWPIPVPTAANYAAAQAANQPFRRGFDVEERALWLSLYDVYGEHQSELDPWFWAYSLLLAHKQPQLAAQLLASGLTPIAGRGYEWLYTPAILAATLKG